MRVRIFVYCLLSFLPYCYFIVAIKSPETGTLAYWGYVTVRLSVNGLLLTAMSSQMRANLPLCGRVLTKKKERTAAVVTVAPVPSISSASHAMPPETRVPHEISEF